MPSVLGDLSRARNPWTASSPLDRVQAPYIRLEFDGRLLDGGVFVSRLDGAETDSLLGNLVDFPACRQRRFLFLLSWDCPPYRPPAMFVQPQAALVQPG